MTIPERLQDLKLKAAQAKLTLSVMQLEMKQHQRSIEECKELLQTITKQLPQVQHYYEVNYYHKLSGCTQTVVVQETSEKRAYAKVRGEHPFVGANSEVKQITH